VQVNSLQPLIQQIQWPKGFPSQLTVLLKYRKTEGACRRVQKSLESMIGTIKLVAGNSESTAKSVEEISSSIEQMGKSIKGVAGNAESLTGSAEEISSAIQKIVGSIEQVAGMPKALQFCRADFIFY